MFKKSLTLRVFFFFWGGGGSLIVLVNFGFMYHRLGGKTRSWVLPMQFHCSWHLRTLYSKFTRYMYIPFLFFKTSRKVHILQIPAFMHSENNNLGDKKECSQYLRPRNFTFQSADELGKTSGVHQQNITTVVQPTHFIPLSGTTAFCAAVTLIIHVIMGVYFYKAVQNFGKGLKVKCKKLSLLFK